MTSQELATRSYTRSSSFIMALSFSVLLGASCMFLAYVIYKFDKAIKNPAVVETWTWQGTAMYTLSIFVISMMLIVILMSFVISVYVVNRINKIAKTANHIVETDDISQRIDISTSWDDLSFVTAGINALLDRMELLLHGVRHVSDNVAHDLRTPLTRFRNHLEMNAGEDIGPVERQRLIDEADSLLNTFSTVLRISQLESRGESGRFAPLKLEELLEDVADFYIPVADERGIDISIDGEKQINGDKDLLFQLFVNIVDNALKFTPNNSNIKIEISSVPGFGCVSISDQGAGLSDYDKKRVTERFYRTDQSRSTKGNGLGLAMVKAIIECHKGDISFQDANPGLKVQIELPA